MKKIKQPNKKFKKSIQGFAAAKGRIPREDDVNITLSIKQPPRAVKTVRDLIFWEYAKIIASSSGFPDNFGFIMNRFNKLKSGEIKWQGVDNDVQEHIRAERKCIYCGRKSNLTIDHIIPRHLGGLDIPANLVLACKRCNSSKNSRDIFEWYYEILKKKSIPKHVWKRYLKLVWEFHAMHRTLDSVDVNSDGRLDILDLGAIFKKK
jgi:hypothetical protein